MVVWAESVGLEEIAQSLHGSGVHCGVIALDNIIPLILWLYSYGDEDTSASP